MKIVIKSCIALALSAFLFACASPGTAAQGTPAPSAAPVAKTKQIKVEVAKPTKEVVKYADGLLASSSVATYDAAGRPLSEEQYDGKGKLSQKKVYAYSADGAAAAVTVSDASGATLAQAQQQFDKAGRLVKETLSNAKGDVQSSAEYAYDAAGNQLSWVSRGPDQSVVARINYIVKDGKTGLIEIQDAGGQVIKRFEQVFDANGKLVSKTEKDASGKQLSQINYSYNGNKLAKEERQKGDGGLQQSLSYLYNDKGQANRIEFYDRRGKLMEYHELEYQIFSRTETVSQ